MIKKGRELLKHPFLSGSIIMMAGSMGANFMNYFYHLVMGRALGPIEYGNLASIYSILYIVGVVPISTSFAIVKFITDAKDSKERNSFYASVKRAYFSIAILFGIVLVILSPLLRGFLHLPTLFPVLLIGPILFFVLITLVNQASLQGLLRFGRVIGPNLLSSATKLILGLILVYLGYSVGGAILAVLIGALLAYLLSVKLVGDRFNNGNDKKFNLKPFWQYSFPVLVQALAFTSIFTVDVILAKHFLPPFQAGIYAALSTLGKIIFFASQPISQVMFPIVSGKKSKGESYRKVFYASFVFTLLVSLAVVLFYKLFPGIAIGVLYGSEYLSASSELVWMGIFIMLYTASYLIVSFLLSIHKIKIVILPFVVAILQIIGLLNWHSNISEILRVNVIVTVGLFLGLIVYLGYNQLKISYAKSK